jgi:hypothetical protein
MKKFLVLFIVLTLFNLGKLQAQDDDVALRIKEQLSPSGKKKMAKAEKLILASNNEKAQAEKLETSSTKKALRKQISASKSLGKANKMIYKIYRTDLKKFDEMDQHDSAKTIKKKLVRAKKIMRRTDNKRETALKLTSDDNIYSLLKDADELEAKAFKDIYFVYRLLLGENTQKQKTNKNESENNDIVENVKPDKTTNEIPVDKNPETNTESEQSGNIVTSENTIKPKNEVISNISNNEQVVKNNEVKTNISNESENIEEPSCNVYFKIQIAASKTQLSVDQLVKNFPTREVLNVEIDGDWYKYSVRKKFTNYDEALQYRTDLKVKGAFIIAIKNGKRVSIEEALKKDAVDNTKINAKENNQIEKVKPEADGKTTYRLQVGFSTSPLSASEISQFKNGGKVVVMVDCGSWFIYTVGEFETESAALQFKKIKGMSEADLVKFINGKPSEE